jgi:hypothetical protein
MGEDRHLVAAFYRSQPYTSHSVNFTHCKVRPCLDVCCMKSKICDVLGVQLSCLPSPMWMHHSRLQEAAAKQAGLVAAFCGQLGWSSMEMLISQYQGVHPLVAMYQCGSIGSRSPDSSLAPLHRIGADDHVFAGQIIQLAHICSIGWQQC